MPGVLVAGCGYLGSVVAALFAAQGRTVVGWRSPQSNKEVLANGVQVRPVDITDADEVCRNSFDADVVVHCAGVAERTLDAYRNVYEAGAANLLAVFPQACLLFTSSTSVYAQTDGSWVNEESTSEPVTETGKSLRRSEKMILAQNGIVLRLAGLYGPDRSFFLRAVREGRPVAGPLDRFVNQIHRDDAAAAVLFLASRVLKTPRIFNVVDDSPARRSEILGWLAEELDVRIPPGERVVSPQDKVKSNKRVSNAKLRALGWVPKYPSYIEGFTESVLPKFRNARPGEKP